MRTGSDVIIIGSGIGGLSAGAYLAGRGYKVKIYERMHQPGGYVHTFKRKSYTFEATTHQLSGYNVELYLKRTLKLLGIDLPLVEHKHSFESVLFKDNKIAKRYLIPSKIENARKALQNYFPEEKELINKCLSEIKNTSIEMLKVKRLTRESPLKHIKDMVFALCLKNGKPGSAIQSFGKKYFNHISKYKEQSFDEMFSYVDNEELKFILAQHCYFLGVQPSVVEGYLISMLLFLYLCECPLSIVGGTSVLLDELIDIITSNNGKIIYKSCVDKIIVKKGKAIGVQLENGDESYAGIIISNANARLTFQDYIKDFKFKKEFKEKVSSYTPGASAFQVYLGLPFTLHKYGFEASTTMFSCSIDINTALKDKPIPNPDSPFLLTNYQYYNPEFSPKGKSSVVVAEFDNIDRWKDLDEASYKKQKQEAQNLILEKAKKVTGIPFDEAEVCFSGTPRTMAFYSGDPFGSIVGAEPNVNMGALNRFDYASPVKNLYIVGSDSKPCGGVSACLDSGVICGRAIDKKFI